MVKTEIIRFPNISGEVTYYIGKSREENFKVIDMGRDIDLWFHVGDGESSCHVICVVPNGLTKKQTMTLVKKGGDLCKQNTAKFRGGKSIEIVYSLVGNVKKTEILGCVEVCGGGKKIIV
jgi:hypothetical protein